MLYTKVCASKSVYLYKNPYSLKVYSFAYAHFMLQMQYTMQCLYTTNMVKFTIYLVYYTTNVVLLATFLVCNFMIFLL